MKFFVAMIEIEQLKTALSDANQANQELRKRKTAESVPVSVPSAISAVSSNSVEFSPPDQQMDFDMADSAATVIWVITGFYESVSDIHFNQEFHCVIQAPSKRSKADRKSDAFHIDQTVSACNLLNS